MALTLLLFAVGCFAAVQGEPCKVPPKSVVDTYGTSPAAFTADKALAAVFSQGIDCATVARIDLSMAELFEYGSVDNRTPLISMYIRLVISAGVPVRVIERQLEDESHLRMLETAVAAHQALTMQYFQHNSFLAADLPVIIPKYFSQHPDVDSQILMRDAFRNYVVGLKKWTKPVFFGASEISSARQMRRTTVSPSSPRRPFSSG